MGLQRRGGPQRSGVSGVSRELGRRSRVEEREGTDMWGRQVRGREGDAAAGERRRQVGHACQPNGASTGMGQRKGEKERAELGWGERGEGRPRA